MRNKHWLGIVSAGRWLLSNVLIAAVRSYQMVIRPIMPGVCRFHPSCSEYFIEAVRKYGPVRGAGKGALRICRCNPWGGHGFDPP